MMVEETLRESLADRYRIERELGAGGMATVYLAEDLKHGRQVAIKVLHPDLGAALGGERFLAEIRTTAKLQHPHILPLLDSGDAGNGLLYYVMPFVRGETLRARLERERQLPIADALRIAREVADALQHAHAQGIVHRDIKPENILLQDGHALVADFGIALAVQSAGGQRLTQTGLSLGTPQYMSPEQAMGERTVDARSDIYALGAVTYEMLAGEPPFTGPHIQAIVAKVLSERPVALTTLRDTVPVAVDDAVRKALAKLPADRFASANEFGGALEQGAVATGASTRAVSPTPARKRSVVGSVAMALGGALVVGGAWWMGRTSAPEPARWTHLTQLTDATGVESSPSLAPDGETFVYSSNARGTYDIYVQRLGSRNPQLIAGDSTVDELTPAWSPDGRQLAFAKSGDGIWVMGAAGDNPRRVSTFGAMPTWSPDGKEIVFVGNEVHSEYLVNTTARLWAISALGGAPRALEMGGGTPYGPNVSPDGRWIAVGAMDSARFDIVLVPRGGGAARHVTHDVSSEWGPTWSADGRWIYFVSDRGGTIGLWRIAMDAGAGTARGRPELVVAGGDAALDQPSIARDGRRLLFRSKVESANPAAVAFDPANARIGAGRLLQQRTSGQLAPNDVSKDGTTLVLQDPSHRTTSIWMMATDGSGLRRLTDENLRSNWPRLTPDGAGILFFGTADTSARGVADVLRIGLDGSGVTSVLSRYNDAFFPTLSPDGRHFATSSDTGVTVWPLSPPFPVDRTRGRRLGPARFEGEGSFVTSWSPDGRWLAGRFESSTGEMGNYFVMDATTGAIRRLNDDSNGQHVAWLPDSRRVVYFRRDGSLVMQDVITLARTPVTGVLPAPPELTGSIVASRDGRTLFYGARRVEANLWMIELEGGR